MKLRCPECNEFYKYDDRFTLSEILRIYQWKNRYTNEEKTEGEYICYKCHHIKKKLLEMGDEK